MTNFQMMLFILLLALKLTGTEITWFWVLCPIWVPWFFMGFVFVVSLFVILLNEMVNGR